MSVVTLLYHDVTEVGQKSSSGFGGPDSEIYKLTWGEFDQQLQALASSRVASYASVPEAKEVASARSFRLAFDDGGVSAERIAERLQTLGWQAHFFVTTDYIDRTRFLSKAQIRSLAQAGHVIGSHSCSHPLQMGRLSLAELIEEWKTSLGLLGDVLGRQILSASIPGGHYQRKVALAAARAGVSTLFTSEPSRRVTYVEGCRVVGRFVVMAGTPPGRVRQLAEGCLIPCYRAWAWWNVKKAVKAICGPHYLRIRTSLIHALRRHR